MRHECKITVLETKVFEDLCTAGQNIPENKNDEEILKRMGFRNEPADAYTGKRENKVIGVK